MQSNDHAAGASRPSGGPAAVVLAAGKGTRMNSELPKVLFPVLGRPMIHWVIDALESAGVEQIWVVVGYRHELVRQELAGRRSLEFVLQSEQLGTGHAVMMAAEPLRSHAGPVMVLAGDSPLVQADSLRTLLKHQLQDRHACLLGTLIKDQPQGLGRIVRDEHGRFQAIVEERDATEHQRAIREVNMSTYLFESQSLLWALQHLSNNNQQREYYLTDCPAWLLGQGQRVDALPILQPCEALSINTPDELGMVEDRMQQMGYRCES
jgi:bifunctional UDP-N-acetylglucosamine pyrophosphorylase / glucosamine-1-phosphate N-acetyltransferase